MDYKQIQELIRLINKSTIGELVLELKDTKLVIKQKTDTISAQSLATTTPQSQPPVAAAQAAPMPPPSKKELPPKETKEEEDTSNFLTIKSPMIGTFYRRPAPDKPVMVDIGDMVAPGKVVCIVEAMKLFNEIESEISGKIVKVLVEDASPVEFDQDLFLVDPS